MIRSTDPAAKAATDEPFARDSAAYDRMRTRSFVREAFALRRWLLSAAFAALAFFVPYFAHTQFGLPAGPAAVMGFVPFAIVWGGIVLVPISVSLEYGSTTLLGAACLRRPVGHFGPLPAQAHQIASGAVLMLTIGLGAAALGAVVAPVALFFCAALIDQVARWWFFVDLHRQRRQDRRRSDARRRRRAVERADRIR